MGYSKIITIDPGKRRGKALIRSAVQAQGFACPEICSPEELFGDDR